MVMIKEVSAKSILDSRGEKTIFVSIKSNTGAFSASAPNGKSRGKHEAKTYKKNLEEDIKTIKKFSDYFSEEQIEKFEDLRRIEDIVDGHIGANTLFALESAVLKALAKEKRKQIWEIIEPEIKKKKFPRLVGNCIGGGLHSDSSKKPDFQEFLLIPDLKSVKENFEKNKSIKKEIEFPLKDSDKNFKGEKNDEDAWATSLNEKEILDIMNKKEVPLGVDVATSSFYKKKLYHYKNPMLKRTPEEQLGYLSNLIKNFELFYIEDPFHEEDFENFALLLKKFPGRLIIGDDLTVTNYKRAKKAIEKKSISAIIVKPNQCGSLLEVKRVCELAKENKIKIVFSHRSGETEETILADLAFGFQADFFKCGITGKVREVKLKRLIEIEKGLR
ncbi:MAG: enolase C-terminal domain-like protein [archaeon]